MSLVAEQLTGNDPYERTMARALATRDRLAVEIPRLGTIGVTEFPDDWLPWLVIHYGLEEIAPYVGDLLRTLKEGRSWQRIVGTPAATEDFVLAWLGVEGLDVPDGYGGAGAVEEERVDDVKWYVYQLALTGPVALPTVRRLVAADRLSHNAGTELRRIYGGYDIRPMRLDGVRLDGGMLDDWSGIHLPGIEPKVSFGSWHGAVVDVGPAVLAGSIDWHVATARFEEGFILDRSILENEKIEPTVVRIEQSSITETIALSRPAPMPWPPFPWPAVAWSDVDSFVIGGPDGNAG
ncbi:hypothetical protein CCR97_23390 [Rhodoplanes elegans]|uniref:Phage tail protein n=1 Tax=Rhodoplanes elegans TaxID=29408 RepID=A0A327KS19_9BRAD|nr:phage tail protein [Rhodoplanes elegans]MBK5961126.1 hypothetical protein [Rhodoplanes elegans]RAI38158.1 hypothetical protein CH338_13650 [Rhodoplanes elegans]